MADLTRVQRSASSIHAEDDVLRLYATTANTKSRHDRYANPSIHPTSNRSASFESRIQTSLRPAPRSRRTLRPCRNLVVETKAYPLPDPSQFEDSNVSSLSSDPNDDILHPMQSLMRAREKERESMREEYEYRSPKQSQSPAMEFSDFCTIDEQQAPSVSENFQKEKIQKSFVGNSADIVLGKLQQEVVEVKKEEARIRREGIVLVRVPSKVVVVYDGAKKFTIAPVDVAMNEYATSEGDSIVVLVFLQHVMNPMGMKMVADLERFSGVNQACLKLAVSQKKDEIEYKLQQSYCSQVCQKRKIQLEVKVMPGANPKPVVMREIQGLKGTCAIFDKNALKDRKYYADNLSCNILRLRSDGRTVETVSLFGQGLQKSGSMISHFSDTSSEYSLSSQLTNSGSIWSKIKNFGSRRYSAPNRHSHGRPGSIINSSRTSSNLGSPQTVVEKEVGAKSETLEESFSFDSPKPIGVAAYVYAAAGLDGCGSVARTRGSFPTVLAT